MKSPVNRNNLCFLINWRSLIKLPWISATQLHLHLFYLGSVLFGFSQMALALDTDHNQMLEIQSNTAELDENKGTAIYRGAVELSQGSLLITAQTLTIYNSAEGVSKVIAEGDPAKYSQTINENKEPVHAHAMEITYYPADEKLVLSKHAKLTQGGSLFEGDKIDYDIQKQRLTANGGTNTEHSTRANNGTQPSVKQSTGRVKMVLPPSKSTVTRTE